MHESHKVASSDLGFHDHDALNRSKNDDHSGDLRMMHWFDQVRCTNEGSMQHNICTLKTHYQNSGAGPMSVSVLIS